MLLTHPKRFAMTAILSIWFCLAYCPHCTALAAATQRALAQFDLHNWRTVDGLPEMEVNAILESSDGYLWVGTQNGLARFDGYRFQVYDHTADAKFDSDFVTALAEDSAGNIWIATTGHLLVRLKSGEFLAPPDVADCLPKLVLSLVPSEDGSVWIGGSARIAQFGTSGALRCLRAGKELPGDGVSSIASHEGKNLWITSGDRLLNFDGAVVHLAESQLPSPGAYSVRAFVGKRGALFLVDDRERIYLRIDGNFREIWRPQPGERVHIDTIFSEDDGDIWVGTETAGLLRLKVHHGLVTDSERSSDGWSVRVVKQDSHRNLWVGTAGDGLFRFREGAFTTFGRAQGLAARGATSVFVDDSDVVWAGTLGGLTRFHGQTFDVLSTNDGLASDQVGALARRHRGGIWIGTSHGTVQGFDMGRVVETVKLKTDKLVSSILEDSSGNLWMGSIGAGLAVRKLSGDIKYVGADDTLGAVVRAMIQTRNDDIYFATNRGVVVKKANETLDASFEVLDSAQAVSIVENDDRVWVGTAGRGILIYRSGHVQSRMSTSAGLPDDTVNSIAFDAMGTAWIGTNRGVAKILREDIDKWMHGWVDRMTVRQYDEADGIKGTETFGGIQPSASLGRDGRIWIATTGGVAVVDPALAHENQRPLVATIETVRVNDERQNIFQQLIPVPHYSRVEIDFSAPDVSDGLTTEFRYRLSGFDNAWTTVKRERVARYSNMTPGHHAFEIQARRSNSDWGQGITSIELSVVPEFYETKLFFALTAAAALGFLVIVQRYRSKWIRIKSAVADERTRLAGEIHDSLAQAFTAISLQIDAALNQPYAPQPPALSHLEIAREISRSGSREVRQSLLKLRDPPISELLLKDAIHAVCDLVVAGSEVQFVVEVNGKSWPTDANFNYAICKIVQEALRNSIRHGRATTVLARLRYRMFSLAISVSDNGNGFTPSVHLPSAGFGIDSMRFRARRLGGRLNIEKEQSGGVRVWTRVPRPIAFNPISLIGT